jgi:hypothetical protein
MKTPLLCTIIVFIILFISNSLFSQQQETYSMPDMGRIKITLPPTWEAHRDSTNSQHLITYKDYVSVYVERSNEEDTHNTLKNINRYFRLIIKVESIVDYNTINYNGSVAQAKVNSNELNSIIIVLNINSNNIIFLGISNKKEYFTKLIDGIEKIVQSIEEESEKTGYIGLSNLSNYKIKLLSGWEHSYEDEICIINHKSSGTKILIKYTNIKNLKQVMEMIPEHFGFVVLELGENKYSEVSQKEVLSNEGTGLVNNKKVGIIYKVIKFEDEVIMMAGYMDYGLYCSNFSLIKEIYRIMSTLSYL